MQLLTSYFTTLQFTPQILHLYCAAHLRFITLSTPLLFFLSLHLLPIFLRRFQLLNVIEAILVQCVKSFFKVMKSETSVAL